MKSTVLPFIVEPVIDEVIEDLKFVGKSIQEMKDIIEGMVRMEVKDPLAF